MLTFVSLPAGVPDPPAVPPAADPQAIRACLTPTMVAEFDREWEFVLELAKQEKDITAIHSLLNKWRHLAYAELKDPGSHFRMLAKAEQIERTGSNPGAVSIEDMRALIERRLGR
jgi:hypothetical protein